MTQILTQLFRKGIEFSPEEMCLDHNEDPVLLCQQYQSFTVCVIIESRVLTVLFIIALSDAGEMVL